MWTPGGWVSLIWDMREGRDIRYSLLNFPLSNQRFVWGHSATDSSYSDWLPGHPNADPHNMDDCVSISFSENFLWRDVPCYEKTAAAPICQRDLLLDTTTVQPTTTPFPGH